MEAGLISLRCPPHRPACFIDGLVDRFSALIDHIVSEPLRFFDSPTGLAIEFIGFTAGGADPAPDLSAGAINGIFGFVGESVGRLLDRIAKLLCLQACYWEFSTTTSAWSAPNKLVTLPENIASIANGVNNDGSVIVGSSLNIYDKTGKCDPNQLEFLNKATRWLRSAKGVHVEDIAVLLGTILPAGWQLYWAERVSADGRIVTGFGYPCTDCENMMGWVAGLPPEKKPREIIDDKK
jgi:hypothetical protein